MVPRPMMKPEECCVNALGRPGDLRTSDGRLNPDSFAQPNGNMSDQSMYKHTQQTHIHLCLLNDVIFFAFHIYQHEQLNSGDDSPCLGQSTQRDCAGLGEPVLARPCPIQPRHLGVQGGPTSWWHRGGWGSTWKVDKLSRWIRWMLRAQVFRIASGKITANWKLQNKHEFIWYFYW